MALESALMALESALIALEIETDPLPTGLSIDSRAY